MDGDVSWTYADYGIEHVDEINVPFGAEFCVNKGADGEIFTIEIFDKDTLHVINIPRELFWKMVAVFEKIQAAR